MKSINTFLQRVEQLRTLLADADAILIGAGSGLSTAAGLDYAGADFRREFEPWIKRYGITDLYTSSFYPFPSDEERWAYWARHIWFSRFRTGGTALYANLLKLVDKKPWFVITTNTDAQFEQSGFAADRIFATQGDYAYLQSASGDDDRLVYDEAWVREAMAATTNCRIPSSLIPRHPDTGEALAPHLRCDDTFVENDAWKRQAERYAAFVRRYADRRLLLLEFGIGFNTPSIIRFPFERMASTFEQCTLVRFNRDHPEPLTDGLQRFVSFTEEISSIIDAVIEKG